MCQIKDFRSEPADDAAAAAKFKLYESFAETVCQRFAEANASSYASINNVFVPLGGCIAQGHVGLLGIVQRRL